MNIWHHYTRTFQSRSGRHVNDYGIEHLLLLMQVDDVQLLRDVLSNTPLKPPRNVGDKRVVKVEHFGYQSSKVKKRFNHDMPADAKAEVFKRNSAQLSEGSPV